MENVPIIPRGRTSEFKDLINDFINETFANLDQVEQLVESLGTDDVWLIEQHIRVLFRTFHSIKGVAGFLQFEVMQALTHDAETLFDEIRRRPVRQGDAVLRAIYAAIDCMRFITDTVRQQGSDSSCRERAEAASAELRRFTPEEALAATSESQQVASSTTPTTKVIGNQAIAASETSTNDDALRASVAVTLRENSVILMTAIKNLTLNEDTPGRIIHIHNVLIELLQKRCLPNESTAQSVAQSASVFSDMMASGDLSLDEYTILTLQSQIETLVEAIDALLQEMSAEMPSAEMPSAEIPLSEVSPAIVPTLLPTEEQTKSASILEQGAQLMQTERSDAEVFASTGTLYAERSEIRVETVKLDRLFDLVGELVTIQTMTLNSPDLKGMKMPNFRKSATMLTKITRQLQTATMSMRMTPIEILFAKMKRIAREVGTHIGKQIELQMSGADTEMDKNVIELMFDPLVHIIRNSIDHGIEPPDERERLGKPATGVIHLSAMYEGSEIVVSVRDDGAGLNRTNILRRAIERGITSADSENLSDAEVWNFIFEPGFSTAQTVTELSGRGVGMDVVKKNIEKLRGSVQVRSREGKGTTITLRIPLTLASMDVMLVRVGSTHYAIPLGAVRQSFRPRASDVTTTMDGVEIVRVRETLYPVLRLHEIFALRPDNDELEKGILIIVEVNAQRVCLSADEVIGQQQTVIKPLSEYIGSVPGLSGYMILSDGRIGLILDVEGLIHSTEESISAAAAMAYTAKSGQQ